MKILERIGIIRHVRGRRGEAIAILLLTILAAMGPFVLLTWRAVGDTKADIEAERLRLAQLASAQADRILNEAFLEIEFASALVPASEDGDSVPSDGTPLRTFYGQAASFSAGVVLLDGNRTLVLAEPASAARGLDRGPPGRAISQAASATDRAVSEPFISPVTGHLVAALSVPLFGDDGGRTGTMIGLLDLTEPLIADLVEPARLLGSTGHADLVDERGLVLASTEQAHILTPGDHPEFYARMAEVRTPSVERVRHRPDGQDGEQSQWHVMAYAPLRGAPWGIALGASEAETVGGANELRRTLVILGVAAAAVLLVGGALIIRRVPPTPQSRN